VSDSWQGSDWWQASDGKWYPPSATPGGSYVPPTNPTPPVAPQGRGPWRRFRGLPTVLQVLCWAVAGFLLLGAIGAATGAGKKPTKTIAASVPTTVTTVAEAPPPTAVATSVATTTSTTVARTTMVPTAVIPTTVAPTTIQPPTTRLTPLPTAAPVTQAPVVVPPPTAPAATPVTCHPLTNSGNCYSPGQYCRNADHGVYGVAGNGTAIVCAYNNGWRWEPTSP
jgi:hypothetical protein